MVLPLFSRASTKRGIASALVAAGAWVVYALPPATTPFYPRCAFHALTGLDCPGCGGTRALHHLLHGRFEEAFRMNALLYAILAVAVFALPSFIRGETPRFMTKPWFAWGSVIVLVGWWIGRNVSAFG